MDQDTFADLAANVARISAELDQTHRDIAQLAEAGRRIYRHLELHDESWENRGEWSAWVETLGELQSRHIQAVNPAPSATPLPNGLPVFLWTPYNYDQEPLVSPDGLGMACYEVLLTSELLPNGAEHLVMYTEDGQGQVFEPSGPMTTNMIRTYWTGVPGYRRDRTIEALAERARLRREPNEGETVETY